MSDVGDRPAVVARSAAATRGTAVGGSVVVIERVSLRARPVDQLPADAGRVEPRLLVRSDRGALLVVAVRGLVAREILRPARMI